LDDVKVRLGFINSAGQQKGVDSLIVTDLIELARQKAICDAVLLSGDEDVRVGVQIAQNYGIRIHLLGISPSRGSQSLTLLQEADTTTEWDQQTVRRFLSERPKPNEQLGKAANGTVELGTNIALVKSSMEGSDARIEQAAIDCSDALQPADIEGLSAYWASGARGLPSEIDRRALSCGRQALGRDLEGAEKRVIRSRIQQIVTAKQKR
jgi:hypothetical protein